MSLRRIAALVLVALWFAMPARAQQPAAAPAEPGSELTVTLITFGVGHEVFERFGHNALRIQNATTGEDAAYHWGIFSFEEPGFLMRFLTGDTKYWMGAVDPIALLESERRRGRPTTLQRLNLTPAQASRLLEFVRWNAREENKFYRYDYYLDNCSTRLRDALDHALGGAILAAMDSAKTGLSYRSESVRLTEGSAPVQAGIDIALGRPADAPLTRWQSFFIPMRLRDALREIRVAGPGGVLIPLVAGEQVPAMPLGVSPTPEAPEPPTLFWRYLLIGFVLAAPIVVLRIAMVSRQWAAWALAAFGGLWSLVSGALGVVLLLAWFATKHQFWGYNETDLLLTPLSLVLAVLAPAALISGRGNRAARMLAAVIAGMGLVALLLALVPGGQQSLAVVAMLLPPQLALAWALALPRTTPRRTA